MPRVAALYDIHGNLPALEAVLADVRRAGAEVIVVGGDVLPGPFPRECFELLFDSARTMYFIHGNGESAVLEALRGGPLEKVPEAFRPAIRWSAEQLPDEYVAALSHWPLSMTLEVAGIGDVLFCHATPRNDTEIFTRLSPDERIRTMFTGVTTSLAVCGHTHMQFDHRAESLRVVNAGSVGMPFADPGAYWLLLGPDVQLRRTSYDFEAAATRIRATAFPRADAFAGQVLAPRSETEMLTIYSQVDGREKP